MPRGKLGVRFFPAYLWQPEGEVFQRDGDGDVAQVDRCGRGVAAQLAIQLLQQPLHGSCPALAQLALVDLLAIVLAGNHGGECGIHEVLAKACQVQYVTQQVGGQYGRGGCSAVQTVQVHGDQHGFAQRGAILRHQRGDAPGGVGFEKIGIVGPGVAPLERHGVHQPASFTRALIGQSEATCHRHCS